MRFTAVLAILALFCSAAFAGQYTALFFPQPEPFSALNESSPGHFGDYVVLAGSRAQFRYISIEGKDASREKLSAELVLLRNSGRLRSDCAPSQIVGSDGSDFLCAQSEWKVCPSGSVCSFSAPEAPAAAAQKEYGIFPPAQDAAGLMATDSEAAYRAREASGGEVAAPPAQPGIALGQIVQLVGALIAVVVASYLVLQQRQAQITVDPQEEKLLDNETRAGIMAELSNADKIPTDLSLKLNKSKATVVEHLGALSGAGFVERVATPGRKYVFYRLTQKGRRALLRRAG